MHPAEVTPVVLASLGSVKREINRKCASLVTLEMCRGIGVGRGGAAREMRKSGETMLGFFFLYDHLFLIFPPWWRKKNNQMPFKRKNN